MKYLSKIVSAFASVEMELIFILTLLSVSLPIVNEPINLCIYINQRSENIFCKGPNCKFLGFADLRVHSISSTMLL